MKTVELNDCKSQSDSTGFLDAAGPEIDSHLFADGLVVLLIMVWFSFAISVNISVKPSLQYYSVGLIHAIIWIRLVQSGLKSIIAV